MINQQSLDFIKQQLAKGLTKDVVSKQLLDNGWTEQDVKEGFESLTIPTPSIPTPRSSSFTPSSYNNVNSTIIPAQIKNHSSRKIFFITLILFLLAGGASAYYFKDSLVNLPIIKNIFPSKVKPSKIKKLYF